MFVYQAKRTNIVDGDTIDLDIDLGFSMVRSSTRVRLQGIDTHEIFFVDSDSEEYKKGVREAEFVEEWFEAAEEEYDGEYPIEVDTKRDIKGKFGRYIAKIRRRSDGSDLSEDLIDEFGEEVRYE